MVLHVYYDILVLLWVVWGVYWLAAVLYERATGKAKPTERRARGFSLFLILLLFVLSPIGSTPPLGLLFFQPSATVKTLGLLVTASGVGLAIWARRYLGANWSAIPSLKKEHTLTVTGPYSVVRHPIYTGILMGQLGSALVLGTFASLLVLVISVVFVWIRIRQEEGLMLEQFGDEYKDYKKKAKTIIPWVL
ncbi:MAG TPA: isoprenylcysteine carboxylmethyltransferase family protein [Nitrososphaerales archaeon]|nr:isoprenylcysteine carboxylmethyltransferase family protein [Nitrososphaerales archaeon]